MINITLGNDEVMNLFCLTLERETKVYKGILGITNIEYALLIEKKGEILSQEENWQYESLLNDRLRESFLRSRYISKITIGHLTREALPSIQIRHGVFNQPLLNGMNGISISHSGDFAACIVFPDEHPMGLDLEIIRDHATETIASQLTHEEMVVASYLPKEKKRSYTCLWTAKEALSKVLHTGLMIPFEILEVKKMEIISGYKICYFKNFIQYKSITCSIHNMMMSMVLPANTNLNAKKINITNNKLI